MRSVDVISVTYESGAEIEGSLRSLKGAGNVSRIVVVDNASTDDSAAAAGRAGADVVIQNGRNLGFARAVNRGLAQTEADLVLLLNPDARLTPGALERLCRDFDDEPGAVIAAPLLRNSAGCVSAGAGRLATVTRRVGLCMPGVGRLPSFRSEYSLPHDDRVVKRAVEIGYAYGAAMLLDRAFLVSIDGLDERFFLFAEDEDVCRQARRAGRRVLLDGRAVADHIGGASCSDGAAMEAQRLFSTFRLFAKWDGPRRAAAYRRGILFAFDLRIQAARAAVAVGGDRASRPTCRATDTGTADPATLRRTARLFAEAVRDGHDPLSNSAAVPPARFAPSGNAP